MLYLLKKSLFQGRKKKNSYKKKEIILGSRNEIIILTAKIYAILREEKDFLRL